MNAINKSELLAALEAVKPGLASTEIIEQSTSFAFMGDKVVTYNDEISISHPVPNMDVIGAVKATDLYAILGKLKTDEILIDVTDNEIILKSGKSKAGLVLEKEVKLPLDEVEEAKKFKELPKDFLQNLSLSISCASKVVSETILRCVHILPEGVMESSDRYRLFRIEGDSISIENDFLLPAKEADSVIKFNPISVCKTDNWIHFKNKKDAIMSCRLFSEKFPEIKKCLKLEGKELEFPKNIANLLDRASVFAKRATLIEEQAIININSKRVKVRSESESGWYEETTKIDYSGDEITFGVAPYLLKFALEKNTKFILNKNMIKFEGENWQYVAMLKVLPDTE